MRENLMCPAHKGTNLKWRSNYDAVFSVSIPFARACLRCDRYFATEGEYQTCQSCRHIIAVSAHKREHGDFDAM